MMGFFKKKHVPMPALQAIKSIERALHSGHVLHTFRSGGGLQVARIEKVEGDERRGALAGYGEHPHISEALRHAGEDFDAGGRPYSEVYGTIDFKSPKKSKKGIYDTYLTGTHDVESKLDEWCKQNTVDARSEDGKIRVDLRGWGEHSLPKDIQDRATNGGETIDWEDDRGCKFRTSPSRFPNGAPCCSTQQLSRPEGMKEHRVWMWRTVQTGRADNLLEAIELALSAKPEETNED